MRTLRCPKCEGSMGEGYMLSEKQGYRVVSSWVAGAPVKSIWTGLKLASKPVPVQTFRCGRCGYLESYANDRGSAS